MKAFRQLTVSILAVTTAMLATGCGHTTVANVAPTLRAANANVVMAAGKARKLGYNVARYESTQQRFAHPQQLVVRGAQPAQVDNRKFCAPIYDQGQLGSCTAFSMAKGLREYLQHSENETPTQLSALQFYYAERKVDGDVADDAGSTMTTGMNVLHDQGAALDSLWPYDITKFAQEPPAAATESAAAWKVKSITQLATLADIKTAVANGGAVAIGFRVYDSFRNIKADGVMPNPKAGEGVLGGHAVLVVGYDDKKGYLTVRNSWGDSWGDKGYFYMSYKFAQDMNTHIMEAWTAQ